jgi:GGDEF domain-containing protein
MSVAVERDLLAEFAEAVAAYLNVTDSLALCLEQTCPEVGGPYRQRIQRMRSRVAFDAKREVIKDSAKMLQADLKDYAAAVDQLLTRRTVELKSGILDLGDHLDSLTQRQNLFSQQLRQFASQLEAWQTAELTGLADNMSVEAASTVTQMRECLTEMDKELAGTASIDPVTGLVNRRELERQIDAHRLHRREFCLVVFELSGPLSDQVMRIAAAKLMTRFRPSDWIGRWSEWQIAVLFLGPPKLAASRAAQEVLSLQGRYTLDNGETVLIAAEARLLPSGPSAV